MRALASPSQAVFVPRNLNDAVQGAGVVRDPSGIPTPSPTPSPTPRLTPRAAADSLPPTPELPPVASDAPPVLLELPDDSPTPLPLPLDSPTPPVLWPGPPRSSEIQPSEGTRCGYRMSVLSRLHERAFCREGWKHGWRGVTSATSLQGEVVSVEDKVSDVLAAFQAAPFLVSSPWLHLERVASDQLDPSSGSGSLCATCSAACVHSAVRDECSRSLPD